MAAKAICKINIGLMHQTVYVENKKYKDKETLETHYITLKDLPEFFANLKDVNEIYISGVSKEFGESIEKETKMIQYQKYNEDTKHFNYM